MSRPRFLVLHALRVKGLASDDIVGALSGLPADAVRPELESLVEDKLVLRREGRFAGSMLTPAGKQAHEPLLADDVSAPATRAALETAYDAFLPINGDFKRICGSWQTRDETGEPNDHRDAAYDDSVITQLAVTHGKAIDALRPLARTLVRFGQYAPRLTDALTRVQAGDVTAFARPMADSYHDIWMELHQDLLLSLRRERSVHDEG
ncbi:MAG: hypothetical protein QOI21_2920 [Actinomycetota bacterium]|jgi:hypothetical protein|nr:hypothetical protein [Actinomycetota bacterium]